MKVLQFLSIKKVAEQQANAILILNPIARIEKKNHLDNYYALVSKVRFHIKFKVHVPIFLKFNFEIIHK